MRIVSEMSDEPPPNKIESPGSGESGSRDRQYPDTHDDVCLWLLHRRREFTVSDFARISTILSGARQH